MRRLIGNRSFRYELKQWNYTKILVTSRKVCNWTRKTFWVNILRRDLLEAKHKIKKNGGKQRQPHGYYTRSICQMWTIVCGVEFLRTSKKREKENTSSYVQVLHHWTSKKCTKKLDARAELLFCSWNVLFFDVVVVVVFVVVQSQVVDNVLTYR